MQIAPCQQVLSTVYTGLNYLIGILIFMPQ
jgi:hypothetical protein